MKLEPGEKLLMSVRKHWFIIFVQGLVFALLGAAPPVVVFFAFKYFPQTSEILNIGGDLNSLLLFFYFLYLLALWVAFFVAWTDYYLDVWYVTQKRIIAIDQKGLFSREIIDVRFEKVQDATIEIRGIIPTFLNFGDLHVQTAGAWREIILRGAKDPDVAKRLILNQHSEVMEWQSKIDNSLKHE